MSKYKRAFVAKMKSEGLDPDRPWAAILMLLGMAPTQKPEPRTKN